jgi:hypothetical protein
MQRQVANERLMFDDKRYQEVDEQADEDFLLERDIKLLEEELRR